MPSREELAVLRFLSEVGDRLDRVGQPERALKVALRLTREFFAADAACIAVREPGERDALVRYRLPSGSVWPQSVFEGTRHREILRATIGRRGRRWGLLALRRSSGFDRVESRAVERTAALLAKKIRELDDRRIVEVRSRIDRKILEQLRTKDLFYQVLDGLRSLTNYDHSSALLIFDRESRSLEFAAEQIAWRKGGSLRVGRTHTVTDEALHLLETREVFGFDREESGWREWRGREASALLRTLEPDSASVDAGNEPREASLLVAPLTVRGTVLGVLQMASRRRGALGFHEAELVRRFLPYLAVAIRNLTRTESLETGLLEAAKKQAMADLALGISHDINNAVGQVLPLVQQMIEEANTDTLDRRALQADLAAIEHAMQVCRRITHRMLTFAGGPVHHSGAGNVRRAIESTLTLLREGLERLNIAIEQELAEELPSVRGSQGDVEQLLLNLATNARDAMPGGGTLSLRARAVDGQVVLIVQDTGVGIAPENLARIWETFFSTKKGGSGLGLPICQSIVWRMQGRIEVESQLGQGTRIQVSLPAAHAPERSSS